MSIRFPDTVNATDFISHQTFAHQQSNSLSQRPQQIQIHTKKT